MTHGANHRKQTHGAELHYSASWKHVVALITTMIARNGGGPGLAINTTPAFDVSSAAIHNDDLDGRYIVPIGLRNIG